MTAMIDIAISLLTLGFAIFPLAARSKQPAIARADGGHGCLDATHNEGQARAWWQQRPQANIGLATGAASGIWVLDVDMHDGKDGMRSLRDLQDRHGPLPNTRVAFTPSGGLHYYFAWDSAAPVRGRTGKLATDLDTRGRGGYVVAPGSILEAGEYAWVQECPAAAAPPWLMGMVVDAQPSPAPARAIRPANSEQARAQAYLGRLAKWRMEDYESWVEVGMSLSGLGTAGLSLWDAWSRGSPKFKDGECERKWRSFEPSGVTLASLHFWANQDSPLPAPPVQKQRMNRENYGAIIARGL